MARLIQAVKVVGSDDPFPLSDLMKERAQILSFANAHAVNLAFKDARFFDLLVGADILYLDGVGMHWLFRWVGLEPGLNMNGTDLIPKILSATAGVPVSLYGSTDAIADAAGELLRVDGVNVVSCRGGFLSIADYANFMQRDRPRVLILGMGMPKQEIVSAQLRACAREPVLIINGGAILDFLANRFPRAPAFVRRVRLEWLFRLLIEPRRLWRRYVIGNFLFICRAAHFAVAQRFRRV